MTGGGRRSAALLATALVVVSATAALLVQGAASRAGRERSREAAAAGVRRLEAELGAVVARAAALAAAAGEGPASLRAAASRLLPVGVERSLVLAGPDGQPRLVLEGGPPGARAVLDEALVAAATSGTPQLAAPVELDGRAAVAAIAPVHAAGTPLDVVARRAAVTGHLVLVRPFAELWRGGPVVVDTPAGRFGDDVEEPVLATGARAGSHVWDVLVGPTGGSPIAGWLVLAAGGLVAAVAGTAVHRQQLVRRRAECESAARARQLEMIAGTSAALQQSLELGDVLPVFCVEVLDEYDLSSITVLVADDGGRLVEVFRHGRPAPADAADALLLRRAGRTVGRIDVRSPAPLDDVDRQALQALADLLAVAVSNAELFQREQQAVARLRELDTLKNAFLGTVSHELRTSSTAVQGFADLLAERWDTLPEDRRRELSARIRRQAGSLRHLVDDLLDYARLEHQSLRVAPRDVSLAEVARHLVDSMAPLLAEHVVRFEAEGDVPAWVDPIAVERILANLLSNAAKYSPAGTAITVRVAEEHGCSVLAVSDQGPGIPVEERRRVFLRFYRLDNAATLRTRGAGIGLSILHDFASRSGADVVVDDAPGGGALVRVAFPSHAPAGALEGAP